MKKILQLSLLLLFAPLLLWAQTKNISGIVSSVSEGVLPGVSVLVKGTSQGTVTDAQGKFSLALSNSSSTLVFSAIGFTTMEVPVGAKTTFDVLLEADSKLLNEVVVTALGISREKKSLGFSQQEVKGESLTESRSTNVANALTGKVAGVRISANGGPGSGSTIQIRGSSSVSGNNQPLIVIDGVPMQQQFDKQFGGGISEVNPDNIKEISVLKGPNAAALYGSRAANGVILITTKNGAGTKGIGIEYNTNYTVERPLVKPNFQNTYGGGNGYRTWYADGWSGVIQPDAYDQYAAAYGTVSPGRTTGTAGTDESWGAPLDGRLVRQWWTGTDVAPLTPQPNNWDEFWDTGTSATHSVALSGGNEKGNFRLGYSNLTQKGIAAFNGFNRNNFKLNSSYKLTKFLSVSSSGEYIRSGGNRTYQGGDNFIWSHRHVSWDQLANYADYADVHVQRAVAGKLPDTDPPNWQHTYFTNPFYLNEFLPNTNDKDRLLGNISVNIQLHDHLKAMLRSGTDMWTDTRTAIVNFERVRNGNKTPGRYSEEVLRSQETNHDFLLTYDRMIGKDFSIVASAGGAIRSNFSKRNYVYVGELVVDGVYNLGNSNPSQNTVASNITKSEVQSLYMSTQFGYKNALFLDVTARNDWSSTLPSIDRSYFYPSVSSSAVLTDLLSISNPILSYGKVRASWAQVGNDADPYQLAQTFRAAGSWNGSIPEYYENLTISNSTLKPEITTGIEFGLDLKFLKNRISVDATYYNQTTKNQILGVEISKASGYDKRILNAGKISNKGVEISISGSPLSPSSKLKWEVGVNYARNRNLVEELAEGLDTYTLQERRGLISMAKVGQPYGTLFGIGFKHAPDGQIIYNNGLPVVDNTPQILGNVQPKWTGGFSNSFTYKRFVLSALIDAKIGGDLFDEGTGTARWTGQYAETAVGREEGIIGKGVINIGTDESPNYVANDVIVATNQLIGYNNPRRYHEAAIFDGSFVKLREMSFGYKIPERLTQKLKIQSAKFSIVGRNLAILFKNTPHIDPEVDRFGGNSQGFSYGELPNSRSLGFNLNLGF
ncbi:SusC/RagA family TonB-linked outer membrane protein [Lacihabitans sp. LS3-19]|uniref:SusC/RagA family TonB-linked outer membrane protein n=1 Tax=Lacihabitans sp. LS3-19 TaxID=2487335 RepID=UPI0020CF2B1E|nr:SusC/RagA family TonB-linked outer membrane protein [Lacihabitans sp. LS3-19]MCP9768853.1 SusC/RagA family TonB-linked outer membrane protein [Lacihabitans sp. LS3-19]